MKNQQIPLASRISVPLADGVEKRLSAYALAAAMGVGVFGASQVANAAVHSFPNNSGTKLTDNGTYTLPFGSIKLTLKDTVTMNSTTGQSGTTLSYHSYNVRTAGITGAVPVVQASGYAAPLPAHTVIGSKGPFSPAAAAGMNIGVKSTYVRKYFGGTRTSGTTTDGSFFGVFAYVGFEFTLGGHTDYGWVRIDLDPGGTVLDIFSCAYQDNGDPIGAGDLQDIPEPGSLGLLAGGAAFLAAWRRRSAKHREAAA